MWCFLGEREVKVMDELVTVLESILSELQTMNAKLDEIKGMGMYDSISDVCDKLDEVGDKINSLETTVTLGDNY
jgi:hypothetical protein